MRGWKSLAAVGLGALLGAAAMSPAQADGITTIRGTVIFKGDPAKYKRAVIDRSARPACEKEVKKVETEDVILNDDTDPITIRNVLIAIRAGLEHHAFPVPKEPAILMQHGCRYKPHILGLSARQPLKMYNADDVAHSTTFLSKANRQENFIQPQKDLEKGRTIELLAEPPFPVESKVFPWMKAYIAVFNHPFFAVTGGTGMYELRGLPAGRYRIDAWHEKLGTQTTIVTIDKGETKTVDFTFEP